MSELESGREIERETDRETEDEGENENDWSLSIPREIHRIKIRGMRKECLETLE